MSVNSQSGDTDSGVHVVEQEGEKDGKHYISLNIFSCTGIIAIVKFLVLDILQQCIK